MSDQLTPNPCPFCKSSDCEARKKFTPPNPSQQHFVFCNCCEAEGPPTPKSSTCAVGLWNELANAPDSAWIAEKPKTDASLSFSDWLSTIEGRKCIRPPWSNTDRGLQRNKLRAAFRAGVMSRECECGDESTGWTAFPCCNICGAIVEERQVEQPQL